LTDWSISPERRLHLVFNRRGAMSRHHVRIAGWIPLNEDPMRVEPHEKRIPTPWIGWGGAEARSGSLTVSSTSRLELKEAAGLVPIVSESSDSVGPTSSHHRRTFLVDDPRRMGAIVWDPIPPRVKVAIESRMTIHPETAQWVAVLGYDVLGGALEAIHLRLPAAWAAKADLQFSSGKYELATDVRGPWAFWVITSPQPLLGAHRFVLRATIPLTAEREITHPEISPLGPGLVDASLGIVNATGLPMTTEGGVGLKKIPYADHFHAKEFVDSIGTPIAAFQVVKDAWVLKAQRARSGTEFVSSREDTARVGLAELELAVRSDRSIMGRAVYETVPDSGRLLTIELPAGSYPLWSSVDSCPVIPLRSSPTTWTIALESRLQARVCLIWESGSAPAPVAGSVLSLPLPRAGTRPAATLLVIYNWPAGMISGDFGPFEPAAMARLEMARADWLARTIRERVTGLDRSAGRDHQRLISMLVDHELALRSAERSARSNDPALRWPGTDRAPQDTERIRSGRLALVELIQSARLSADLEAARTYLGESTNSGRRSSPPLGIPEPIDLSRIRCFGRPTTLMGVMPGTSELSPAPVLTIKTGAWDGSSKTHQGPHRLVVVLVLVLAIILATMFLSVFRGASLALLLLTLGLAGYAGGPALLVASLALAAMSWRKARP
jgi:hypothetical protein